MAVAIDGFVQFQFTHPGKGATSVRIWLGSISVFQFTHPGKGATAFRRLQVQAHQVSIHAPWEGCDLYEQREHLHR